MTREQAVMTVNAMVDQFADPRPQFIAAAKALLFRLGDGWTPSKERGDGIKLTFDSNNDFGVSAVLYIRKLGGDAE